MRLVLRLLGTWLIGLALILLVMDGTKSLAANDLVFTSLGGMWSQLHSASLETVSQFFDSRFFADLLGSLLQALLSYPAFAVLGIPGIILALAGRRTRRERFLRQEQF
jgi:ABC-type nitrate/sulfonate/bicarbonate transport system permease component